MFPTAVGDGEVRRQREDISELRGQIKDCKREEKVEEMLGNQQLAHNGVFTPLMTKVKPIQNDNSRLSMEKSLLKKTDGELVESTSIHVTVRVLPLKE